MCTRPREYVRDDGRIILGPCKMCIECRNMRREDFKQRMQLELIDYNYIGSFITLTYRDKDLPILLPEGSAIVGKYFGDIPPAYSCTLYRPDISNFCDKMQKRLKRKFGRSGKYIAVGEYGNDGHRCHWHIVYIGCPPDRKLVLETWKKGMVDVGPIGKGAIRYVLDYLDKQVFGYKSLFEEYGDFTPPFAHFSKGIGFNWIKKNIEKFDKYGCLTFGDSGKKLQLNPYLIDKFGFEKKPYKYYPDSVIQFAKDYNYKDLRKALLDRARIMKTKYEHDMINGRNAKIDTDKLEERYMKDKFFQKYGYDYDEYYKNSREVTLKKSWENHIQ